MSADTLDFTEEDFALRRRLGRMSSVLTHAAEATGEPGIVAMLGAFTMCHFIAKTLGISDEKAVEMLRGVQNIMNDSMEYGEETMAQTEIRKAAEKAARKAVN